MTSNELPELRALSLAVDGLEYPSESDAPFEPFHWDRKPAGSAREQVAAHVSPGRPIEEVTVAAFFEQLADSDDAERFTQLRSVLEAQLSQPGIFRVPAGAGEIDLYLVGQTRAGEWVGLHTVSVET